MDPILTVDEHRNAAFSVARGRLDAPLPTPHPAPDPNGTWQQRRIHKSEPEILSPTSPITQLLSGAPCGPRIPGGYRAYRFEGRWLRALGFRVWICLLFLLSLCTELKFPDGRHPPGALLSLGMTSTWPSCLPPSDGPALVHEKPAPLEICHKHVVQTAPLVALDCL